ncbi:MAG: ABC transporter permease [Mycobacteriales bacterium]|nr:ABC transporter permease [Frankia sp.]
MTVVPDAITVPRMLPWSGVRRPGHVVERNARVYRHGWFIVASGALEPLTYLFAARLGIGRLVGSLPAPSGRAVSYAAFVAPALLAASAANGAVYDTTFNFFHKLKWERTYDAMLTTPMAVRDVALGELGWALLRGLVHSTLFISTMLVMGLMLSWWALLVLPAVVLVSWAFAGLGLAATTYVRTWQDFDWQQLLWLPMFLLSASFFPITVYPEWTRWIVRVTPLYQGVALLRVLVLGGPGWSALLHAAYLGTLGWLCVRHATRRMRRILLR